MVAVLVTTVEYVDVSSVGAELAVPATTTVEYVVVAVVFIVVVVVDVGVYAVIGAVN